MFTFNIISDIILIGKYILVKVKINNILIQNLNLLFYFKSLMKIIEV